MSIQTPQELVRFLVAAGYPQAVIADRAGVKQPTISRILSGEHDDPKSSVLIKLSEFADEISSLKYELRPAHAHRRATDPLPAPGHAGRQPPSPSNILDSVPRHSVVLPALPPLLDPKEKP